MEKLNMHTTDIVSENIKKISALFPNCLTEHLDENGKVQSAVDFDLLRQELSRDIVEGREERYQFTWPDKRKAIITANAPTTNTLRPCREESVNFDTTENLYIEGDNLEVLKLLRENYLGKVKMIYIDPPYNTGNDFVYEDDFSQDATSFQSHAGMFDDNGNMLLTNYEKNLESNGRFHTDWLNMMYPRLKVARDLLSEDGVVFISIDDNEVENLKKICNEVFGESNFVALYKWNKTATPPALSRKVRNKYEYVLCYEKKRNSIEYNGGTVEGGDMPLLNEANQINTLCFPVNSITFKFDGYYTAGIYDRVELLTDITIKDGIANSNILLRGRFKWSQENLNKEICEGTKFIIKSNKFAIRYIREGERIKRPSDIISKIECGVGTNEEASKEVATLFGSNIMTYPKPITLIKYLIPFAEIEKDSIILDFFSGSATTAHAVMQLNAEDGGNRKFIMVQLPEKTDENSEAYKAGYKNICEIGKERIRRAGKKIKAELEAKNQKDGLFAEGATSKLDIGFRVLKLAESNMEDVYYAPNEFSAEKLIVNNVKEDRNDEDLLFQVLPECNLPLSSKIETLHIHGKSVFSVNDGYLMACFDENINEETITEIAKMKPYYFISRDKSLASDNVADNFEQIFRTYSNDTKRRIL